MIKEAKMNLNGLAANLRPILLGGWVACAGTAASAAQFKAVADFDQGVVVGEVLERFRMGSGVALATEHGPTANDLNYDCVVSKRFLKGPGQLEKWTDETTRTRGVIDGRKGGNAKFSNGSIEYLVRVGDTGATMSLQDLTSGLLASSEDLRMSRIGQARHLQLSLLNQKGGLLGERDTRALHLTCAFD